MILALETTCDDTCAAVLDARRRAARATSSPRQGVHDRFGGVVPEIASRHHLELVNAVVDDALATAGATLDDVELVAVTQGPGLVGALLSASPRPRRSPPRGGCRSRPSTTSRATSPPTSSARAVRAAVPVPDRLRRPHAARPGGRPRRLRDARRARSTTPPARRSTRARGCSASATRAARRCPSSPLDGDPAAFAFPDGRAASPAWTSPSPASRPRCSTRCATWGRTTAARAADLAASYEHAIVEALIEPRRARGRRRRGCERVAIGGGVAANRAAARARRRRSGVEVHVPPPRAVHGQRRDDRLRGALGRRPCRSRTTSALDAYATGAARRLSRSGRGRHHARAAPASSPRSCRRAG